MKLLALFAAFSHAATTFKCGSLSLPCIFYDQIFSTLRNAVEDGSDYAIYLDSLEKLEVLDYVTNSAIPVINEISAGTDDINIQNAMIEIFSDQFAVAFQIQYDVEILRDVWIFPVTESVLTVFKDIKTENINSTTLFGKVFIVEIMITEGEKFMMQLSNDPDFKGSLDRSLEIVGYIENILDISIFALESSFNGTGDILELAEVAVDLLASIFIDDKNIKEYITTDLTALVQLLASDDVRSMLETVEVILNGLVNDNLREIMNLNFDVEAVRDDIIIQTIHEVLNSTLVFSTIRAYTLGVINGNINFGTFLVQISSKISDFNNYMMTIYQATSLAITQIEAKNTVNNDLSGELAYFYPIGEFAYNMLTITSSAPLYTYIFQVENYKLNYPEYQDLSDNEKFQYMSLIGDQIVSALDVMYDWNERKIDYFYNYIEDDYVRSLFEDTLIARMEILLSENLGGIFGIKDMEEIQGFFISPVANITMYFLGEAGNNDYGFLDDSDENIINLLQDIRFLKNCMENIELILDGLYWRTDLTEIEYMARFVSYVNDILLLRIGWIADQQDALIPSQFKFSNTISTIIAEQIGGNYTDTGVTIENIILLIQKEYFELKTLGINFSADTLEDSLETLQDLLEQTGILLVQILVATPEDEQNQQLQYWANLLDVSSDVTAVPLLISNSIGLISSFAGILDNINQIKQL